MTAEETYVDPSALTRLYLHQPGSAELVKWRARTSGPLPVTHHGRVEMTNAISLACFRGEITVEEAGKAWNYLDHDFASGLLVQADILWRAALQRAGELSRSHSPKFGSRSLDVLHVACALELKLRNLLTFDERQKKLAVAVGLKPVTI